MLVVLYLWTRGLEEGDEHPLCFLVEHGQLYLYLTKVPVLPLCLERRVVAGTFGHFCSSIAAKTYSCYGTGDH